MRFLIQFLSAVVDLLPYLALGWFIVELVLLVQRKKYLKGYRKSGKSGYKSKNKVRFIASGVSIIVAVVIHNLFYIFIGNLN